MNFARALFSLSLVVSLFVAGAEAQAAPRKKASAAAPVHDYKGAIVIDAATGGVLFEDNADVQSPPASMTKLMTFAVLEDCLKSGSLKLDTPVTVIAADSKIGGTQVWLKEGEVFPVEELIYAMMIQSANDGAYALARTAAGSVPAFVERMNAKARELGMNHTLFRSPHGLPPASRNTAEGDLTSPRDFAILSRYLLLNTDVLKYTSVRTRNFGAGKRMQPVVMNNHNHLLGKVAGVDGLKTGFTNGAGYCLTATAERNHHRVLVVMMGCADRKLRDLNVAELLERGFASLPADAPDFVGGTPKIIGETVPAAATAGTPAATDAKTAGSGEEPMIKFNVPTGVKSAK